MLGILRRKHPTGCGSVTDCQREVIKKTWPLVHPQAGCRQLEASHPLPILRIYVLSSLPTLGAISRMQPCENNVLLRPTGLDMWAGPCWGLYRNFKILAGGCRDLLTLWLLKTRLICKFPCLLKFLPINLECPAPFLSLLALHLQKPVCKLMQIVDQKQIPWSHGLLESLLLSFINDSGDMEALAFKPSLEEYPFLKYLTRKFVSSQD